jgi:gamma-glutamylcyclotransferase (GGCT)/AIG2-like uncharacterized protein YtfP
MSARVVLSGEELRLDRDLRDGVEIARRGHVVASGRGRALPLFVYGSLRRGRSAASLLERWSPTWLGEARVRGVLYDLVAYPGWCPFELRAHGFGGSALTRGVEARGVEARDESGFVRGELVVLPDPERALEALDAYEDFFAYDDPRSLYLRVPTRVQLLRGDAWEETTAWAYAWNGHGEHPIVASGCWER